MPTINLSSPWVILYHQIKAMFEEDKTVKVVLNEENYTISVYTQDPQKACALDAILTQQRKYGNVTVTVEVPAPNTHDPKVKGNNNIEEVYMDAFEGNPALSYIVRGSLPMVDMNVYVVFKNKVVQYFNDNLMDINGFCSTLYENIAREIFVPNPLECLRAENACFCTDTPENLGKPTKEWP